MDATLAPTIADDLTTVLREYMDVSERLRETHEKLQSEVVRLREELASKDQELERRRRLAALGELAAGVAHEVRNPLGAIQLYSGLLRTAVHDAAPALELVDKIQRGVEAIDRVVQDTLSLTPRAGRLGVRRLQDVVLAACDACEAVLRAHDVELRFDAGDADALVRTDGDGLLRVLINLITNAAEASPAGGVVAVRASATRDGALQVRVSDEGPGLPAELFDRVFDPFFTTKQSGTGLGLTIAHRLVEAHGGVLRAGNRPAGGAEFTVNLPRAADDPRRAEQNGAVAS
ncbi:MAG: PAS domain-containing sensor histidine kinase [Phycisphaerae bacterium]